MGFWDVELDRKVLMESKRMKGFQAGRKIGQSPVGASDLALDTP